MTKLAQRLGLPRYAADERYQAALRAFIARDLQTAKREAQFAIDLLPTHAEYQAAYGFFLLEDKANRDKAGAKAAFELALRLNPYEMLANYGSGMLAYQAKDWAAAGDYFLNALAAQPARAETQYYLAMVSHRLGQNDAALRWMAAARAAFAKIEDRRERHCRAWQREFEKLLRLE